MSSWGLWGLHTAAESSQSDWKAADAFDDEYETWDDEEPVPRTGVWYHSSPHKLEPGTRLLPGHRESVYSDFYDEEDGISPHKRKGWVWLEPDKEGAAQWTNAHLNNYLYEVHPEQEPHPWNGTGSHGHVTPSAVVKKMVGISPEGDYEQWHDLSPEHTASTDGIRYAHIVEADVAEDLMRLAGVRTAAHEHVESGQRGRPDWTGCAHPECRPDLPTTMYHVSHPKNRDSIARHGLLTSYSEDDEFSDELGMPHGIYMTADEPKTSHDTERWPGDVWAIDTTKLKHLENDFPGGLMFRNAYATKYDVPPEAIRLHRPSTHHTARLAAVTQDLVDRLHNEFHQWHKTRDRNSASYKDWKKYGDPDAGPISNWPSIESFLKDRYPAAHRGFDMGLERAMPSLDFGHFTTYETGPEAEAQHGYDPAEVVAGMLLLHNRSHPLRGDLEQGDQERLNDIAQKRYQMQRAYERRNARRRIAADDPTAVFVERLRALNYRHRLHNSRHPVPDRVTAKYPPLSEEEHRQRQRLNDRAADLDRRWDDMAPMTDLEVRLHTRLKPMAHQHDDLENLPDRRKARYFADLSNPDFLQGAGRTKREQHHYATLQPWADQYFDGMQQQARNDLKRWDDYHAKGYHWNGNSTLEGDEEEHALHNTADWGAEMTRPTIERTPVREKLETSQFLMLRNHADEHRKALEEMAAHGPLHYNPDRHRNVYAYQNVEDSRNRLHVELQHRKVFTPRGLDDLPKVAHPREAHAEGMLVNPRHHDGLTPGAIYEQYAEQRAFKINCQRCVLAAEARHRGYNVEAQRNYRPVEGDLNHPDNDKQFGDHDIAAWFSGTGIVPRWQDAEDTAADGEHHWNHMHNQIKSWGPGARGIVAVTYKTSGGETKRHVLKAHVRDDGTVNYFDPQDGSTDQDLEWRDRVDYAGSDASHKMARDNAAQNPIKGIGNTIHNKYYSPLRFLRIDDKDLHHSVARHVVSRGTAPDEPLRPHVDAGTRN